MGTNVTDTDTGLFDTDIDDEMFDAPPPSEWANLDDLAVGGYRPDGTKAGRAVIFYPESVQLECEGDTGTYKALYGDLLVLDGPAIPKLPEVPGILPNFKISGAFIVPGVLGQFTIDREDMLGGRPTEHAIRPKIEGRYFVVGRLDSVKNKRGTLSWKLIALDDATKPLAKREHAKLAAARKSADPFG